MIMTESPMAALSLQNNKKAQTKITGEFRA